MSEHPSFYLQRIVALGTRGLTWAGGMGLVLGCWVSCTAFEPGTDELSVEVQNATPLPGQDWSCLSTRGPTTPIQANVPTVPTSRVVYSLRLLDLATQVPVQDVRVRACALTNLNCDAPVGADQVVDADGWVDIPLPEGFSGYLEMEGPTTVPTLFLIPPELPAQGEAEFPGVLPSTADYELLAAATLGRPLSPDEGSIAFRVFDCAWNPAVGVSVSADVPAQAFYFQAGLPSPRATATDEAGIAGMMGLAPGLVSVRTRQADGLDTASPRGFIVRAGWMSSAFVKPRRQVPPSE